jgi:hypothetical protein
VLLADKNVRGNERIKLETEAKKLKSYQEILESTKYSDWLILITDQLTKITTLSKSRESDINVDWVQITFFLLSRLGDWDMAKTGTLTRKQMRQIKEFMVLESNEGVPLDPPVAVESTTDVKS